MSAGETNSDSLVIRPGRRLRYLYVLQAIDSGLATREADERFNVSDHERAFSRRVEDALGEIPEDQKRELHEKKQIYSPDENLDFPFALDRDEAWYAAEAIWAYSYAKRVASDGRPTQADELSGIAYAFLGTLMRHSGRVA